MKLYVSHLGNYDYTTTLYTPLKSSTIAREHDIFFPYDKADTVNNTKTMLQDCDLVIAEVSHPSTGQGIELGWANAYDKPVLCLYETGSKLSRSLNVISNNFIEYEGTDDMIKKLTDWLGHHAKAAVRVNWPHE